MDKILFIIVFFYYLYTVGILYYLFTKRKKAYRTGEVEPSYFKSYITKGTEELVVLQNHFNSQFQIPIFFFITCITAKLFNTINGVTLVLAILFVVSRLYHSYVHLNENHLIKRSLSFFSGLVIICLMWIQILISFY